VKTISLKKVSAVAVASLGFGLLSVVPAQAATPNDEVIVNTYAVTNTGYAQDLTTATVNAAVPVAQGTNFTADLKIAVNATTETIANGDQATVTYVIENPNGTDITSTCSFTLGTTPIFTNVGISISGAVLTIAATGANTANNTAATAASVSCPTTSGGIYKIKTTSASKAVGFLGSHTELTGASAALGAVLVSGSNVTVAASGTGTTAATGVVGGEVKFTYTTGKQAPAQVNTARSTGVGSITLAALSTTAATKAATVLVNTSDTSSPAVATIDGISFSSGAKLTGGGLVASGATSFTSTLSQYVISLTSAVEGTQTVTISTNSTTTGAPTTLGTVTVTWSAAPTLSTALSTSFACPGAVSSCSADATVLAAKTAQTSAANRAASIFVVVRNSAGTDLTSASKITVSIAGPGTLGINSAIGSATSAGRALTGAAGEAAIAVYGDGTEGKATITISVGSTVLATETVSFYGAVAKVVATQGLSNPLANGYLLGSANATSGTTMTAAASWANASGNVPAVVLTLTDASGNLIPNQQANVSAVTSDATVMSKTVTVIEDTTAAVGAGNYNVSVSSAAGSAAGKSATLTFRVLLADGVTYVSSAPVTFTTGSNKISKVAITLDKTTYTAGDPAVMTVKATDAAGLAVADGLYASSTYAAPLFSKSIVAISTMPTDSTMATIGGKKDYKFYAPSVPGAFTVTGTYINSDAGLVATTGTASVTDGNAAIITQIDALNAKIVALNALIAKIMKKLGVK
jgi:hypothetical protein